MEVQESSSFIFCIQIYSIKQLITIKFKNLLNFNQLNPRNYQISMYESKLIKINKPKTLGPGSASEKQMNLEDALETQRAKNKALLEKYNKSQYKVKYLMDQLNSTGEFQQLPEGIEFDILQIDTKIKSLQQQLYFKKSNKMDSLREKIKYTLELINVQVAMEDLIKIKDQVSLILFLLDVIQERYNQLTSGRIQIDEAVQNLKNSNVKQELQQNLTKMMNQNKKLIRKVKQLQNEIPTNKNNLNSLDRNNSNKNLKTDRSQKTIDGLKSNILRFQQRLSVQQVDLQKKNRKLLQYQSEIAQLRKKAQITQEQQERMHKDQVRWRERYRLMENQKNQRITILEQELAKFKNYQINKNKNLLKHQLSKDANQSGTIYYDF